MGQFGQELRQEREVRGVSVGAICAATKVSQRHVEALEEGRLHELPGGVFRKGIMRSYIAAVGLDEALWIDRFEATLREKGLTASNEPDWSEFAENIKRSRRTAGPPTGMRWFGVVLMVLAVVVCGWFTWHYVLHGVLRP
jgi:cytoskeleton protein RodZ